jgi:hypothetical protein
VWSIPCAKVSYKAENVSFAKICICLLAFRICLLALKCFSQDRTVHWLTCEFKECVSRVLEGHSLPHDA